MQRSVHGLIAAGVLGLAATSAFAQVPADYPVDYARTIEAANKEGKLLIYSPTDATSAQPLLNDFKVLYPQIAVEYSDLSTAELYNRVISEKAAG